MSAAGWVIVALCLALTASVTALCYAWWRGDALMAEVEDQHNANHAACTAHIADMISNRVIAIAFRELARRWESVEEKVNLTRLAREKYKAGGPSMPAIWLNQQADLIDPVTEGESK